MSELTYLVIFFLFNSLQIFGFYHATKEGQALEVIGLLSESYLGEKISKAVCNCPPCMASLHSFAVWCPIYYVTEFSFALIYVHAIYILALSGLNKLIVSLRGIDL